MKTTKSTKKHIKLIKPKSSQETVRLSSCAPLNGT